MQSEPSRAARSASEIPDAAPVAGRRAAPVSGKALAIVFLALTVINLGGLSYYMGSLGVRVRHPLHFLLKPSGYIGQSLGLIAVALFLFLWLYPIRKKYGARLAFTGGVAAWLDWHVAAGLAIPWLAATHAGWRFTGMIGLGFAAMFIVYLSGMAGRYIYVRIPRRRDGLELTRDEISTERERLLFELTAASGLPPSEVRQTLARGIERCEGLGLAGTIRRMIADDFARRRAARDLARRLGGEGKEADPDRSTLRHVVRLAQKEMALSQQVRMMEATQRALRYWHIAHRPVAVTALLAVLAHIIVAVVMGATWLG